MKVRDGVRMVGYTLRLSLRADKRTTILVGVFVLFTSVAGVGTATAQRWLVDAAGLGLASSVVTATVFGVLMHVLSSTINLITSNYHNDLNNRIQLTLEQQITEASAHVPTVTHLERHDFLNRVIMLRRGAHRLAYTGWAAAYSVAGLAGVAGSLWLLADVHPALALVAVAAIPILPLTNRANRLLRAVIDSTAESIRQEKSLHELFLTAESAKEIRTSGNGHTLSDMATGLWHQVIAREERARLSGMGIELAGWALYFTIVGAGLAFVGHLLATSAATPGDAVMLISLTSQFRAQMARTVSSVTTVADGGRVAEHYRWLVDYARDHVADGTAAAPTHLRRGIELQDVWFTYPGSDVPVLRGVSLTIPASSSLGLVGINGAGKSTLVKLLTGVYRPDGGTITVDGIPLGDLDPAAWTRVCTGAFQDFQKFQFLLHEAVGVGDVSRLADLPTVAQAIEEAGANRIVDALPGGLHAQLGALFGGVELSHGQWQGLALARGLMRDEPLLTLLDEPTAALDPQAEHDLYELFTAQTRSSRDRGAVTLLVSHRFSTVHMADHIVVLSDGKVAEHGTHQELMADGGEYAKLYQTQELAYR
ncbi:ABC transporter ATP-binding protein [Nonomuraea rosea]|uniref:ABC transporter ATP-binding protein n=1 Tax=Nonomuraea rosea TaxID=638574 RepID=A0ABP7A7T7_9ACTN